MIQLSLLLLLLTLQTTIQASDQNELKISTYKEWQAQKAAELKEAEYAQILENIREKHMKQRATKEEEKEQALKKRRNKILENLRINMSWDKKTKPPYTTSMAGQHGQQTKAGPVKKHPKDKNFGVSGKFSCPRCTHTTRNRRYMNDHLKTHHTAKK